MRTTVHIITIYSCYSIYMFCWRRSSSTYII